GECLLPTMTLMKSSGAPLFAEEKRQAAFRLTPNFIEEYGVSAIGVLSTLRQCDFAARADSVGQLKPWIEAQVVDEGDRPLAAGAVGRLRVRGPGLGSPISIAGEASPDFSDGWLYPGEIVAIDEFDYLYIKGRTSDVIMRGGAKIYPAEIEA